MEKIQGPENINTKRKWSDEETKELIAIFESKPELWNSSTTDYSNRYPMTNCSINFNQNKTNNVSLVFFLFEGPKDRNCIKKSLKL